MANRHCFCNLSGFIHPFLLPRKKRDKMFILDKSVVDKGPHQYAQTYTQRCTDTALTAYSQNDRRGYLSNTIVRLAAVQTGASKSAC